jgi:hypothetical protein
MHLDGARRGAGCGVRRVLVPLGSALLAAVLGTLLAAAPAAAHTRLVSSTPAAGATAEAPDEVVLVFSDPVQPGLSAVSVTGEGGEHAAGTPSARGDGTSVSQALRAPLAPGTYRVAYRVLASDGHPITGELEITAAAATAPAPTSAALPAPAAPAPEAPATEATPAATTEPTPAAQQVAAGTEDGGGGLPVLPLAVGGLLVAGGAGLLARRLGATPGA